MKLLGQIRGNVNATYNNCAIIKLEQYRIHYYSYKHIM